MKALIAMSGGVDSSVAAHLMAEKGYDCIGCTMKLYSSSLLPEKAEKTCCSLDDVEDARSVACRLGMPYYVFNLTDTFQERVIDPFICSYMAGRTPNPCIDCNRFLKFEKLYERANALSCEAVATGHYARITSENGQFFLKKAADPAKDQSYVLYSLTQKELRRTLFPLGGLSKQETRALAEEHGFLNAGKADSQDICFVPDGDYASFIERSTGNTFPEGNFIDRTGKVLGRHRGIIHYTIGQRRGLGIAAGYPVYVTGINAERNEVVLGEERDLYTSEIRCRGLNLIPGWGTKIPHVCGMAGKKKESPNPNKKNPRKL